MSDAVINGVFSIIGVSIGSLLSLLAVVISNRRNFKKEKVQELLDEVIGYWNLEEEMAKEISRLNDGKKAVSTIKTDFRNIVYGNKGIRPAMTETEANKLKRLFK